MKGNIQHSTPNVQRPRVPRKHTSLRHWALNVECSVFACLLATAGLSRGQTNALPALIPAYPELPSTFWQMHQASIIVIGFVLLAVTFLVLLAVMLREKQTVQPPEQIAREALVKLSGQSENGKVLSAVSQILRRYFGSILGFQGEMTTAEFSAALAAHPNCDARFAAAVSSLLQACDKDKFSARTGAPPLNAVQRALQFIELVERSRRQPSAAGKPNP